jgi:hypothetical protein
MIHRGKAKFLIELSSHLPLIILEDLNMNRRDGDDINQWIQ